MRYLGWDYGENREHTQTDTTQTRSDDITRGGAVRRTGRVRAGKTATSPHPPFVVAQVKIGRA